MPKLADNVNPKYRLHAQSGQALVSIAGRQILLGKYGSPESREKYERVIFEWRASGRQAPSRQAQDKTISELLVSYREHVLRYYRHPDGRPTGEAATIRGALRPLRLRYGATLAAEFGPLQLKALRESMIRPADGREGWARKTINKHINRIRQFFKWAVADGHIPGSVLEGLRAVDSLRPGRSEARETEPVRPVPEAFVYAVLPYVSRQVAAMIRLQMLTGARPGELCDMKATDIDRSGAVWIFKPQSHKTQHLSHSREILIGPKAQEILSPFLTHNLAAPVFSPFTAEAASASMRTERRLNTSGTAPATTGKRNQSGSRAHHILRIPTAGPSPAAAIWRFQRRRNWGG
jgi:integrase